MYFVVYLFAVITFRLFETLTRSCPFYQNVTKREKNGLKWKPIALFVKCESWRKLRGELSFLRTEQQRHFVSVLYAERAAHSVHAALKFAGRFIHLYKVWAQRDTLGTGTETGPFPTGWGWHMLLRGSYLTTLLLLVHGTDLIPFSSLWFKYILCTVKYLLLLLWIAVLFLLLLWFFVVALTDIEQSCLNLENWTASISVSA